MSTEASVTGTSAECADGTLVLLEATPWRLPIEGEPCECEQEAVNGVVMAGCTNGTVETAEPQITDIDGMTLLGGGPAQRVGGVDEGDKEHEPQTRLPKAEFYCEETNQRSGNANENVPNAYRLPLEGEWEVCASSEARDLRSSVNVPNATPERMHCPSKSSETEDAEGVELEGCEGGMDEPTELLTMSVEPYVEDGEPSACIHHGGTSERVSIDEVDSDPGREVEPTDSPNEPEALITVSIELEYPDGSEIPRVCIGGTSWRACDVEGHGDRADESKGRSSGWMDVSRAWMDTLNVSNSAKIACISHNNDLDTYLGAAGTKRPVHETDGVRNHADAPIGHRDTPSVETETETAENKRGNRSRRWKGVSTEGADVYLPWDVPVEVPSRTFVFGQVEGAEEAIAPNVDKRAGDGGGDRDGGDVDGTTSGDTIDST
ncbi:hypothetical protein SCLCIDRAFT_21202 [Scleroderma citrinum Foug A]|uniref:Uncharacterized protein n=1 Tax=Scleroderma citrinum Foug A TaxID=1036808 RepID=A0A0C3AQY7_9AGAM|nr:hypothetical protein SCLCIDRAFT_21202 [Scleroderma citrinum Foug A]